MTWIHAPPHLDELSQALAGLRQRYAERQGLEPWDVEWLEFRIAALEHQMAIVNSGHPAAKPPLARRTGPAPAVAPRATAR